MIKDAFDGENVEASSSSETTEDWQDTMNIINYNLSYRFPEFLFAVGF